jgi:hypothetical protein
MDRVGDNQTTKYLDNPYFDGVVSAITTQSETTLNCRAEHSEMMQRRANMGKAAARAKSYPGGEVLDNLHIMPHELVFGWVSRQGRNQIPGMRKRKKFCLFFSNTLQDTRTRLDSARSTGSGGAITRPTRSWSCAFASLVWPRRRSSLRTRTSSSTASRALDQGLARPFTRERRTFSPATSCSGALFRGPWFLALQCTLAESLETAAQDHARETRLLERLAESM